MHSFRTGAAAAGVALLVGFGLVAALDLPAPASDIVVGCASLAKFLHDGSRIGQACASASLTLSHKSSATGCSGATCAVTLSGAVLDGDLLLMTVQTTAAVNVSSLSAGGVWTQTENMSGDGAVHYLNTGYVYPATAAAGPITVTFDATAGADASVYVYDYTVTGTPALDSINNYFDHDATSPFTQPPLTLSGTGCTVLAMVKSNGAVTAVNGSWTDTIFSGNAGTADQVNVSSVATPQWTATMGIGATQIIGFCFHPTTAVKWGLFDSSAGTNGGTPSAATLANSTHGLTGAGPAATASRNNWYWDIGSNATPGWTYATAAHHALLNSAPRFMVTGATYSDSSTVGLSFSTSAINNFLELFAPGKEYGTSPAFTGATQVACYDFWTDVPVTPSFAPNDLLTLEGPSDHITAQFEADGTNLKFGAEGSVEGTKIIVSPSTWYKICHKFATGGTGIFAIYDDTGTQVSGSPLTVNQTAITEHADRIVMGDFGGSHPTAGHVYRVDKLAVCWGNGGGTCPFPIHP